MRHDISQGAIWNTALTTWFFRINTKNDHFQAGDEVLFNTKDERSMVARNIRKDNRPKAQVLLVNFQAKTYKCLRKGNRKLKQS